MGLELFPEFLDERLHRPGRGLAQRTDRVALDVVGDRDQQIDVARLALAVFDAIEDPLEPARALTKGDSESRLGHAERVLQLVDGRLSVRRIIDLSRLGTFDATRALAELRQAGVIDLTSPKERVSPGSFRSPRSIEILPTLRTAFATLLPFVALGFMASSILQQAGPGGDLAGSVIPERFAHQVGRRFETELVRGLVEAHFFETGRYPVALEEIAVEAALERDSLTKTRLADYYYVVRDDEVVLLAPAR